MGNRRTRTIGMMALGAGSILVISTLLLERTGWDPTLTFSVLILVILVLIRLSPFLYRTVYASRLVDLPLWFAKRYLIQEYNIDLVSSPEILLLRPPSIIGSAPDCGEALGIGYIASVLRQGGYRVKILDARLLALDAMQTIEAVLMDQPPKLGINLNFETLLPVTAEILKGLRKRGYQGHITLGGLYASVAHESIMTNLPEVDTLVRFEGEETYPELIEKFDDPEGWASIPGLVYRRVDGEIVVNPLRSLIANLDRLPQPDRDYLPLVVEYEGFAYVLSSRGCNGVCSYCIQQRSVSDPKGERWRGRDPQEVVQEIGTLINEHGVRNVSFVDDDLFGGGVKGESHAHRLAKAMIESNLKANLLISVQPKDVEYQVFSLLRQAGLASVILAVDNFSQAVLDRYRKFCSVKQNLTSIDVLLRLDIDAYLGMIMFDPWTSLQELEENFEMIRSAYIPYLRPWQLTESLAVYHGSSLLEKMEHDRIPARKDLPLGYAFQDPRVESVYQALNRLMKMSQPYFSALDRYRWGSIGLGEIDRNLRQYCKDELYQLYAQYNQFIASMALDVLQRQLKGDKVLVDRPLILRLKQRNNEILQTLQGIRLKSTLASAPAR